jgi:hypothetical protein
MAVDILGIGRRNAWNGADNGWMRVGNGWICVCSGWMCVGNGWIHGDKDWKAGHGFGVVGVWCCMGGRGARADAKFSCEMNTYNQRQNTD